MEEIQNDDEEINARRLANRLRFLASSAAKSKQSHHQHHHHQHHHHHNVPRNQRRHEHQQHHRDGGMGVVVAASSSSPSSLSPSSTTATAISVETRNRRSYPPKNIIIRINRDGNGNGNGNRNGNGNEKEEEEEHHPVEGGSAKSGDRISSSGGGGGDDDDDDRRTTKNPACLRGFMPITPSMMMMNTATASRTTTSTTSASAPTTPTSTPTPTPTTVPTVSIPTAHRTAREKCIEDVSALHIAIYDYFRWLERTKPLPSPSPSPVPPPSSTTENKAIVVDDQEVIVVEGEHEKIDEAQERATKRRRSRQLSQRPQQRTASSTDDDDDDDDDDGVSKVEGKEADDNDHDHEGDGDGDEDNDEDKDNGKEAHQVTPPQSERPHDLTSSDRDRSGCGSSGASCGTSLVSSLPPPRSTHRTSVGQATEASAATESPTTTRGLLQQPKREAQPQGRPRRRYPRYHRILQVLEEELPFLKEDHRRHQQHQQHQRRTQQQRQRDSSRSDHHKTPELLLRWINSRRTKPGLLRGGDGHQHKKPQQQNIFRTMRPASTAHRHQQQHPTQTARFSPLFNSSPRAPQTLFNAGGATVSAPAPHRRFPGPPQVGGFSARSRSQQHAHPSLPSNNHRCQPEGSWLTPHPPPGRSAHPQHPHQAVPPVVVVASDSSSPTQDKHNDRGSSRDAVVTASVATPTTSAGGGPQSQTPPPPTLKQMSTPEALPHPQGPSQKQHPPKHQTTKAAKITPSMQEEEQGADTDQRKEGTSRGSPPCGASSLADQLQKPQQPSPVASYYGPRSVAHCPSKSPTEQHEKAKPQEQQDMYSSTRYGHRNPLTYLTAAATTLAAASIPAMGLQPKSPASQLGQKKEEPVLFTKAAVFRPRIEAETRTQDSNTSRGNDEETSCPSAQLTISSAPLLPHPRKRPPQQFHSASGPDADAINANDGIQQNEQSNLQTTSITATAPSPARAPRITPKMRDGREEEEPKPDPIPPSSELHQQKTKLTKTKEGTFAAVPTADPTPASPVKSSHAADDGTTSGSMISETADDNATTGKVETVEASKTEKRERYVRAKLSPSLTTEEIQHQRGDDVPPKDDSSQKQSLSKPDPVLSMTEQRRDLQQQRAESGAAAGAPQQAPPSRYSPPPPSPRRPKESTAPSLPHLAATTASSPEQPQRLAQGQKTGSSMATTAPQQSFIQQGAPNSAFRLMPSQSPLPIPPAFFGRPTLLPAWWTAHPWTAHPPPPPPHFLPQTAAGPAPPHGSPSNHHPAYGQPLSPPAPAPTPSKPRTNGPYGDIMLEVSLKEKTRGKRKRSSSEDERKVSNTTAAFPPTRSTPMVPPHKESTPASLLSTQQGQAVLAHTPPVPLTACANSSSPAKHAQPSGTVGPYTALFLQDDRKKLPVIPDELMQMNVNKRKDIPDDVRALLVDLQKGSQPGEPKRQRRQPKSEQDSEDTSEQSPTARRPLSSQDSTKKDGTTISVTAKSAKTAATTDEAAPRAAQQQRRGPTFEQRFEQVKKFCRDHQHCQITRKEPNGLGRWACRVREVYKTHFLTRVEKEDGSGDDVGIADDFVAGNPSVQLTKARIAQLREVGFDFNLSSDKKTWDYRYEQLKRFRQEHGHANIGLGRHDNEFPGLANWVFTQRRHYRKREKALFVDRGGERLQKLNALGFQWRLRHRSSKTWEERFEQLAAFQEKHGNLDVPHPPSSGSLRKWRDEANQTSDSNITKVLPMMKKTAIANIDCGAKEEASGGDNSAHEHNGGNATNEGNDDDKQNERKNDQDSDDADVADSEDEEEDGMHNKCEHTGLGNDGEGDIGVTKSKNHTQGVDEIKYVDEVSFQRWVHRQRSEYFTKYMVGKHTWLTKQRVDKLRKIGFTFGDEKMEEKGGGSGGDSNKNENKCQLRKAAVSPSTMTFHS